MTEDANAVYLRYIRDQNGKVQQGKFTGQFPTDGLVGQLLDAGLIRLTNGWITITNRASALLLGQQTEL